MSFVILTAAGIFVLALLTLPLFFRSQVRH